MPTLRPLLLELRPVMTKLSQLSATPMLRHSGRAKPTFIRSKLRSILRPKQKATVWEPGSTAHLKKSCAFKMYTTRTLASPIPNLPTKRALPRAASSTNEEATFSVRTSRTAGTSSVAGMTFSGCKSSSFRSRKSLKNSFRCRRWTKRRSQQSLRRHDLPVAQALRVRVVACVRP
ncbi:unknown [Eggerthella sp. CAG:298]|nr:unknown [Eggerthella sp. CAG:298]